MVVLRLGDFGVQVITLPDSCSATRLGALSPCHRASMPPRDLWSRSGKFWFCDPKVRTDSVFGRMASIVRDKYLSGQRVGRYISFSDLPSGHPLP